MKREGESFSEVLLRLIEKKSTPVDFFGALKDILDARKTSRLRDVFS